MAPTQSPMAKPCATLSTVGGPSGGHARIPWISNHVWPVGHCPKHWAGMQPGPHAKCAGSSDRHGRP
eukprot:1853853-Pyramimonas_sp.AAC.1